LVGDLITPTAIDPQNMLFYLNPSRLRIVVNIFSICTGQVNLIDLLFIQVTPREDKSLLPSMTPSETIIEHTSKTDSGIDVSTINDKT
jgi:hypothetical protein